MSLAYSFFFISNEFILGSHGLLLFHPQILHLLYASIRELYRTHFRDCLCTSLLPHPSAWTVLSFPITMKMQHLLPGSLPLSWVVDFVCHLLLCHLYAPGYLDNMQNLVLKDTDMCVCGMHMYVYDLMFEYCLKLCHTFHLYENIKKQLVIFILSRRWLRLTLWLAHSCTAIRQKCQGQDSIFFPLY